MIKLKLIRGLSYSGGITGGGTVSATAKKPFVEVETLEDAEILVKSGHFEVVDNKEKAPAKAENTPSPPFPGAEGDKTEDKEVSVDKMTKKELLEYASAKGIDISDCTNNKERAARIKEVLEAGADPDPDMESLETDAEPDFGE